MKLGVPFLQLPLKFDAAALAGEIEAIGAGAWRPHPQGYAGNDALPLISKDGNPNSDDVTGPMRPTLHLERCPYLLQVLDSIGATWGRSRLMRLSGRAEVTAHIDVNYYWRERVRVHVPIVTQPTVRFVCGDAQVNMGAGECWIFDTWREHNVFNDDRLARVHLVADTVGGPGFWQHIVNSRPHDRVLPAWQPRLCPPVAGHVPRLAFESENVPLVMTPWEIRSHYAFALQEVVPHANVPRVQQVLLEFGRVWQSLWACFGERRAGWPSYRLALTNLRQELAASGVGQVLLRNGLGLADALSAWILDSALADGRVSADPEVRERTGGGVPSVAAGEPPVEFAGAADDRFDRPVFIVSPPRSGSTLLFETLMKTPDVYTIGDESHQLIEGIASLNPGARGFDSNRLVATDATPRVIQELRARFLAALRNREQRRPAPGERIRMLEKTPKNALRIPFLAAAFPDARFIYLYRDPRQVLSSMIEAWTTGRFQTYPQLPGWTGLPWSLLLIPGWRELVGQPLPHIVATQWRTTTQLLIDDLTRIPRDRWIVTTYDALLSDPVTEVRRLCVAHGLAPGSTGSATLPLSSYTVSPPDPQKWRRHASLIEPLLPFIDDQVRRAQALLAK